MTAAQLASMRRQQGQTREQLSYLIGRTPRWLMFAEEGRIPLTEEVHDDIMRGLTVHMMHAKDPGAVVAAAVDAAFPGSNLTSNQQSN